MKTHVSHSLEETQKIAKEWLDSISRTYGKNQQEAGEEALIVGLSGHLGAGKTAFVKSIAKEFGIEELVTSPTFVLMKVYLCKAPDLSKSGAIGYKSQSFRVKPPMPWKKLIHIDAYRLEKKEELERLDWERLVSDPDNIILMEWPDNVGLNEFKEKAHLKFEIADGKHTISY